MRSDGVKTPPELSLTLCIFCSHKSNPHVIIISSKSLDHKGRDLAGKSIYQIE